MTRVPIRPNVKSIPLYVPGQRAAQPMAYKLSSNEAPFPPLPGVLAAVADAAAELNRYPNAVASQLARALAEHHQVEANQIVIGAGSLGVLASLVAAFAGPGDQIIYPWRSFEAYPLLAAVAAVEAVQVPLAATGHLDLAAMAQAVTPASRLILLCSPNNPTGPSVEAEEFASFMEQVPPEVLVVVDNAYTEYVTNPAAVQPLELVEQYSNLVVVRTFSKAYGLAGMRVGYAIGQPRLIAAIQATTYPFSVSSLSQMAALVSLGLQDQMIQRVAATVEVRQQLWEGLVEQGWLVPPSDGNFVWLPAGQQAVPLGRALCAAGLTTRPFDGDGVRITTAEPETVPLILDVTRSWV